MSLDARRSHAHRGFSTQRRSRVHTKSDMPILKAFLVEDSPVIRENLIATLEELAPVQVIGFAEAEAGAMDWLEGADHTCDLLIVDLFLV